MKDGYKKAALRIHGLGETDRQWILGNLPEKEQGLLSVLLAQLSEMKLPENHLVFSDMIEEESSAYDDTSARKNDQVLSEIKTINNVSAALATAVLSREPDWMIALALIGGDWDWTEELINQLGAHRRERVHALIQKMSTRVPSKLRETIIDLLAKAFLTKPAEPTNHALSRFDAIFGRNGAESGAERVTDRIGATT